MAGSLNSAAAPSIAVAASGASTVPSRWLPPCRLRRFWFLGRDAGIGRGLCRFNPLTELRPSVEGHSKRNRGARDLPGAITDIVVAIRAIRRVRLCTKERAASVRRRRRAMPQSESADILLVARNLRARAEEALALAEIFDSSHTGDRCDIRENGRATRTTRRRRGRGVGRGSAHHRGRPPLDNCLVGLDTQQIGAKPC
jgi:hypothetical protein